MNWKIQGVKVDLDLFDKMSKEIPHIASISPAGEHMMLDLDRAGGIPAVLKTLESKINTQNPTCTGLSIEENLKGVEVRDEAVIRPLDNPVHTEGGIAVLKGNLST